LKVNSEVARETREKARKKKGLREAKPEWDNPDRELEPSLVSRPFACFADRIQGFRLLTPALSSFEEEREKMSQAAVLVLVY